MSSVSIFIDVLNYISGSLYAILWVPQIYSTIKAKSAKQLNRWVLIICTIAASFMVTFGAYYGIMSIYIPISVNLLMTIILLIIKIVFDCREKITSEV